jgi:hypothetical protein
LFLEVTLGVKVSGLFAIQQAMLMVLPYRPFPGGGKITIEINGANEGLEGIS